MTTSLKIHILSAFLLIFFSFSDLFAQTSPVYRIHVKAMYDAEAEQVIIRWAPGDFDAWMHANQYGYKVERTTFQVDGTPLSMEEMVASQVILADNVRPLPEEDWQPLVEDQKNDLAGVIAGSIYSDSLEVIDMANTTMMSVVNASKARDNRFGFSLFAADQSLELALAAGLAFVDNTAVANAEYVYVIDFNDLPSGVTAEKGLVLLSTFAAGSLPQPTHFTAQPGNLTAMLSWDRDALKAVYSSYVIERLDYNSTQWQVVNSAPFLSLSGITAGETPNTYIDTLPMNGVNYYYRVKGKSPFGIYGPPSEQVLVVGRPDPVNANPEIHLIQDIGNAQLKINWRFPANLEGEITGFDIQRSRSVEGEFTTIGTVSATARDYTDLSPSVANYYMLIATDNHGNRVPSLPVLGQPKDETPPATPPGFTGECNINGVVTLRWSPNAEPDLAGYRLYMSDNGHGDSTAMQITPVPVTDTMLQYNVTLENLTENMYFAIRAVDFHGNQSEMSPFITVKRADILAPSAALISKVYQRTAAVELEIIPSSSTDVVLYHIQKRAENSPLWITLDTFSVQTMPHNYVDSIQYIKKVNRRRWYFYRVLAEDEAGNMGSCKPLRAKPNDMGIRDSLEGFSAVYQNGDNTVRLSWYYPEDIDLTGFQIYRGMDTSQVRSYKAVHISQVISTDPNVIGMKYYVFEDTDTKIKDAKVPIQTFFAQPVDITGTSPVPVKPTLTNQPVNPTTTSSVTLKYSVMGVFADGALTPLAFPAQVNVPQF